MNRFALLPEELLTCKRVHRVYKDASFENIVPYNIRSKDLIDEALNFNRSVKLALKLKDTSLSTGKGLENVYDLNLRWCVII